MTQGTSPAQGERRNQARSQASGTAQLLVAEPVAREITGQLVDRSEKGFRLTHHDPDLVAGERVRFTMDNCSGVAMVVWRRILPQHIECGFMIE